MRTDFTKRKSIFYALNTTLLWINVCQHNTYAVCHLTICDKVVTLHIICCNIQELWNVPWVYLCALWSSELTTVTALTDTEQEGSSSNAWDMNWRHTVWILPSKQTISIELILLFSVPPNKYQDIILN
jgi:hypothetical protein